MEILESIICKYYNNDILGICCFLFACFFVATIICLWKKGLRYFINKNLHELFNIFVVVCLGETFSLLGLEPKIDYIYFNVMFFILTTIIVIVYGILQGITFLKIKIPILQVCKNMKYIVLVELFLLTVTNHLDALEWIVGTLFILFMEMLSMWIKNIESREEKVILKESGYPNPDLFYTREKQLERFIPVLEQQKEEPYAIMISGEWGTGKSSFVQALEKRLKEDIFIWLRAGSEKSVAKIMLEISTKMKNILKENNILIEKAGLIEKYFMAFSGVLEKAGVKFFNLITLSNSNNEEDSKEYLNSKLKELHHFTTLSMITK